MGLFDLFKSRNINDGLKEYKNTENAILVDVREKDEYKLSHIPGAINLPLSEIKRSEEVLKDKNQPIFLYCQGGGRSGQADSLMRNSGYTNTKNIGGFGDYDGEIEK